MTSRTSRTTTSTTTTWATTWAAAVAATLVAGLLLAPGAAADQSDQRDQPDQPDQLSARPVQQLATPVVVGHRGASGYRPEHTLAAYRLAIRLGADYIEPDLVSTRDGVLVARHENEISGTTDVAEHPEFADRRTTRSIDGRRVTGWFTEDFTLAELRTLRAVERLPGVRPDNTRYDGRFTVPTFTQVLRLVRKQSGRLGRTIGVAPETKHPTYFDEAGLSLEEPMLAALARFGLDKRRSKVLIQSFETTNLREVATLTKAPVEQLMSGSGAPYDLVAAGDDTTYADLASPEGLAEIATYADWIGPEKSLVVPREANGSAGAPTALVDDAHTEGLRVAVYTVRDENQFMPTTYRRGVDPDAKGDVVAEVADLLDAGIDGFFADHPDSAVFARRQWLRSR